MAKQKKQQQPSESEILTIIAGAIAVGATAEATANRLSATIPFSKAILLPILVIAMSKPVNFGVATIQSATASAASSNLEPMYRAYYILNAAKRVEQVIRQGGTREEALKREQTFFNQHLEAVKNRRGAAAQVDKARARYGDELGWYAKMDSRTSEECREANGRNFNAAVMPPIGYPGAVHPHCRCRAGKAHATRQTVYTVRPRDFRGAA